MRTVRTLLPIAALVVAACGAQSDSTRPDSPLPDPAGEGGEKSCGSYEELRDGACSPVQVLGVASHELSFERGGHTLHGTLTLPETEGAYLPPLFVLAHGSGPIDRDATSQGALGVGYGQEIRTFALLAEALGEAGAAVYRYDKRTCFAENSEGRCARPLADYPGDMDAVLVADFVADLRAAVQAARAHPAVDGDHVTVVGHSQAANFVPLLVQGEPGVIAGVQLAGASLPIDQVITGQLREFADFLEDRDPRLAEQVASLREQADRYEAGLAAMRAGSWAGSTFMGASVAFWLDWMEQTDHLEEDFLAVERPLLLLAGTFDYNVAPHHLERFRAWADAAGRKNVESHLLEDVTHGFVTVTGGGTGIDPNFSPMALEALLDWHRRLP